MKLKQLILLSTLLILQSCGGSDDGGNTNQAPIIDFYSYMSVLEGETDVGNIVEIPSGQNEIFIKLVGGADRHLFTISDTGTLKFIQAPDFENPSDDNQNNKYELVVQARDDENILDVEKTTIEVVNAIEGRAIDGPLSGSVVFIDLNGNKIKDEIEPSSITNSSGYFVISTDGLGVIFTAGLGVIVTSWRLGLIKPYKAFQGLLIYI